MPWNVPRPGDPRQGFTLLEMLVVVAILAVVAGFVVMNVAGVTDHAGKTVAEASLCAVRDALCGTADAPGFLDDVRAETGFNPVDVQVAHLLSTNGTGYAAFDPVAARGWRGPYVQASCLLRNTAPARAGRFPAAADRRWDGDATFRERGFYDDDGSARYGASDDSALADPWGNPIVLQVPPPEAFSRSSGAAKRFRYARLVSAGPDGALQTPYDDRTAGRLEDGTCASRGDDLVLFLSRPDVYEDEEP